MIYLRNNVHFADFFKYHLLSHSFTYSRTHFILIFDKSLYIYKNVIGNYSVAPVTVVGTNSFRYKFPHGRYFVNSAALVVVPTWVCNREAFLYK